MTGHSGGLSYRARLLPARAALGRGMISALALLLVAVLGASLAAGADAVVQAASDDHVNWRFGFASDGLRDAIANFTPQAGPLSWQIPLWVLLLIGGLTWAGFRLRSYLTVARGDARLESDAVPAPVQRSGAHKETVTPGRELPTALRSCRRPLVGVAVFSAFSNILMLAGAMYMLDIYDRVLPSRSVPTLVGLSILLLLLYAAQGALDILRARVLGRIGAVLDASVGRRIYELTLRQPLIKGDGSGGQPHLRDFESIRAFVSGGGPIAFFDLPWIPLYLIVIFMFHPVLGLTATLGAGVLVALTFLTGRLTAEPNRVATTFAAKRHGIAEQSRVNAEVLVAMGMSRRMGDRFEAASAEHNATQLAISDVTTGLGSLSRVLRIALQSAMLGVGAYLVIQQQATAGVIIAGTILVSRALAPVDLAIANWKGFVNARQAWARLSAKLAELPAHPIPMPLPDPKTSLSVEGVSIAAPGRALPLIENVSFSLGAGQALGIIGPSGSGKSTLVRALVGAWRPAGGRIRLDNADLEHWAPEVLGRHVGYLPQDVALCSGTVTENISRFEVDPDPEAVIAAAQAAGVHDVILDFPEGYGTQVGERGMALSGGQRQRIGLARALYGDPFLVVLDEPNSNIDAEGETALTRAMEGVRRRGGILIIVAHRPSTLAGVSHMLVLNKGRVRAFGPRDQVLSAVFPRPHSVDGGRPDGPHERPAVRVSERGKSA